MLPLCYAALILVFEKSKILKRHEQKPDRQKKMLCWCWAWRSGFCFASAFFPRMHRSSNRARLTFSPVWIRSFRLGRRWRLLCGTSSSSLWFPSCCYLWFFSPISSLSAFLLIDFQTHHFCTFGSFLFRAWTTSGIQIEYLCWCWCWAVAVAQR